MKRSTANPRVFSERATELSVIERRHRQGGDTVNVRAGDPNLLINIAHVARNNVAEDIIDIGTIRTVANCSALSQVAMAS
jgi:hypothetical protein